MDIKLNKNQRKFFEEAIKFYGKQSKDVRFKALKEFADLHDLIVPTSALKKYCQETGQTRGHYNLLLVGIEPPMDNTEETNPDTTSDFGDEVIIEKSSFAVNNTQRKKRKANILNKNVITWDNPVYVLLDFDYDVVSVHSSPKGAFDKRFKVLHDHGDMEWVDVEKELKYNGRCGINSSNSSLFCLIQIMELEK